MSDFLTSIGITSVETLLSALATLVVYLIAIKLLMRLVDRVLNRSTKLDGTLKGFVRSAVNILLWIVAVIAVANALGINTSSLVALVSVVGLALSLSVQNMLSNLFAGLTLLVAKPFVAGEFVEAAGKSGVVKTVGLFYTQLDTVDNTAIYIPNSDMTASSVKNFSREPNRRVDRVFSLSYDSAPEDVTAALLEAIAMDARILPDPAPFVRLSEYGSNSIDYVVRVWCRNSDYWDVYFTLNENVNKTFKAHNVAFSYDHVNVHMIQG